MLKTKIEVQPRCPLYALRCELRNGKQNAMGMESAT
jgi:hypothetical protein